MTTLRLAALFARRQYDGDRLAVALPIAAFAVVVALLMVVLGGSRALVTLETSQIIMYQVLTALALALLMVPLLTLGSAAAKLSARRRDARLSSLALLGATSRQLTGLTVIDSAATALIGALIGSGIYAALVPLVGLVSMGGARLGSALWLPFHWIPLVWLAIAAIAAASALLGMRGVLVTPLGVRTRQRPRVTTKNRLIAAGVMVGIGFAIMASTTAIGQITGPLGLIVGLFVAFGCGVLALDAIGPWYLSLRASRALNRADTLEGLLAARSVLDDPLTAWRNVAGLALATFVSVVAAAGLAIAEIAQGAAGDTSEAILFGDMRTGVFLTLGIAFVMVAATIAISQAVNTLERARIHVSMDRLGVPDGVMVRSARRAVMLSVTGVMVGATLLGVVLMFPLIGVTVLVRPMALVTMGLALALGLLLVRASASIASRLVPGILARPERAL